MIERPHGLNDAALEAIAGLERRVLAADGGRLKLEWGALRHRRSDEVRDLLWWEDGRLVGYAGLYKFGRPVLEVTGMVDPERRRRGIARGLWAALLAPYQSTGERLLMIVPGRSRAGARFAAWAGGRYEHAEHALRLSGPPRAAADARIGLREATLADVPLLSRLYDDGFHDGGHVDPARLSAGGSRTLVVLDGHDEAGTIRVARHGARGAIHGFVVASSRRGQGIGRAALLRACHELFAAGAEYVDLEVEVANTRALDLYTRVGFVSVGRDDYYSLTA